MLSTNLTNHFLIAMPNLDDPNFFHTVTYVCAHNEEGAMGIVINRPMDLYLGEVLEQMDIDITDQSLGDTHVFEGGPVMRERGFVIHEPLGHWEAMLPVGDDLAVTTSKDVLNAVAHGDGPENSLIALGYAGWGAGQLEQELSDNTWLSGPADRRILFETPSNERWSASAALLGVDLNLLSNDPGHA